MPRETGNRLADYARGQIGDALRTVVVLYENDCVVVYLRDDLRKTYTPEQYREVADSFRTDMRIDAHSSGETSIGQKRSLIHYHENAYVFQFPHDDCHSILMSVKPSVGSRLRSFINECQKRI